jgi:hypothetical protein
LRQLILSALVFARTTQTQIAVQDGKRLNISGISEANVSATPLLAISGLTAGIYRVIDL